MDDDGEQIGEYDCLLSIRLYYVSLVAADAANAASLTASSSIASLVDGKRRLLGEGMRQTQMQTERKEHIDTECAQTERQTEK